jgi:hypothetical protein
MSALVNEVNEVEVCVGLREHTGGQGWTWYDRYIVSYVARGTVARIHTMAARVPLLSVGVAIYSSGPD